MAESYPDELPTASTIVDSARLVGLITEFVRSDPTIAGSVLLTLSFDEKGMNTRRDLLAHSTGPIVADSVQQLVFETRRQTAAADEAWGVRLEVEMDDPVRLLVRRREFCPAIPNDRSLEEAMSGFNPAGVRYRSGRRQRVIQMRAHVNASGLITAANVERGGLGGSALEREIFQYLQRFHFRPATIDGYPVRSYVQIPVIVAN